MSSVHLTFKHLDKATDIQMGCFLGCFGFDNKTRKRRNPLHSDASATPDIEGNFSYDLLEEKPGGRSMSKIKKRVRFDLEVKVYELVPEEYDEIEEEWEFLTDEIGSISGSELRPENRYGNCRDDINQNSSRGPKLFRPSIRAQTRDGKYMFDVLNPVENLSQWKADKKNSKAAVPQFKCQKENPMPKQEGAIAVDVSLSNWLGSS